MLRIKISMAKISLGWSMLLLIGELAGQIPDLKCL